MPTDQFGEPWARQSGNRLQVSSKFFDGTATWMIAGRLHMLCLVVRDEISVSVACSLFDLSKSRRSFKGADEVS